MAHCRFHCPAITTGTLLLSPEESRHAIATLRVKPGDPVVLFDGAGTQADGRVSRIDRGRLEVAVGHVTRVPFDLSLRITLAVAMPKTHRQGYLVEKCTELGVAAIWPLVTTRGVAMPGTAALTKWRRRAIEAAKQSGRAWVPSIGDAQSLERTLDRTAKFDGAAVTDVSTSALGLDRLFAERGSSGDWLILVGPEGGWTDEERVHAREAGALSVRLAPTILRTETAAVAVCVAAAMAALSSARQPAND